jgi:hypothetical protein
MSLALFPVTTSPSRRPGRPRVADSPDERAKHLAVARARLLFGASVKRLAVAYDTSERTILRWTRAALGYDGPEADALRRLDRDR